MAGLIPPDSGPGIGTNWTCQSRYSLAQLDAAPHRKMVAHLAHWLIRGWNYECRVLEFRHFAIQVNTGLHFLRQ